MSEKVRVVFARVCNKCESIVGGEKVQLLTQKDVEDRLQKDPTNFLKYKDVYHQAEYRAITPVHSCIQC